MFKDKLKKLLEKEEGGENNKRKIENLVFFIILLIITVVAINLIWNGNKDETNQKTNDTSKQLATTNTQQTTQMQSMEETNLETKLGEILSKIQGVGEVKVLLNYSESSEILPMYNETSKISNTEEADTSGGTRKIQETDTQKDIIYQEDNGEKTPITQKVVQGKIEGAIITAKGASQANVKANIIQAVEAVTGLATHKIQVFEME